MQWNHQSITGRRKKRLRHFSDNFQRWIVTKSNQHMALYSLNVLIGKYLVDLGTLSPVSKVSLTREWTSERYYQHSKIKFVSPRGHVISSFMVNVKCRMDGSHSKPYICLSFDFLIQYSVNGTCLTSVNMHEYVTSLSLLWKSYIFPDLYWNSLAW